MYSENINKNYLFQILLIQLFNYYFKLNRKTVNYIFQIISNDGRNTIFIMNLVVEKMENFLFSYSIKVRFSTTQ